MKKSAAGAGQSKSETAPARACHIQGAYSAAHWRQAQAALGREHGLGAGREAGDWLCQLVQEDGKLVAALVWCAAAWHLQARDETVGWDAVTRSRRLKLVVQLRRFLLLEATRRPNLASQCLGVGLRELPGQWETEQAIGLRVRDPHSGRLKLPGYDALNDLLGALDPAAYARALTAFLQAHAGRLPRSLALDGKSVGNGRFGMIVTLCRHEDGRPVAMTVARGKKEDSEVSAGRALLADPQVELVHALVTADPLHNKADTVRAILDKGGDYLIGTKENTSQRLAGATQALKDTPLLT